ncbi:MAG: hypothetical protein ACK2T4_01880 [Candidatus Promineifilaceae bacterium]|jgi:exosome complex RNA-binding protein Rrp4
MSEFITVDCTIGRNGRVWIHRVKFDDDWMMVDQGRQWQDENGRHVLIMRPGRQVEELLLSGETLRWELMARPGRQIV